AALALGVDRVERERGLSGPRQPGDDDQPVARQVEADVLEIVGTCSADADEVERHRVFRGKERWAVNQPTSPLDGGVPPIFQNPAGRAKEGSFSRLRGACG